MTREAGILLPIFSLPSRYGIGCFSKEAYDFVDWLKEAGQSYWQILPLCQTSYGDSPYQSFSTYAGNPYFISLDDLIQEGVLTQEECDGEDWGEDENDINYYNLYYARYPLLRKAYERSDVIHNQGYLDFIRENSWWLDNYALFMAVKGFFDGACWKDWPQDIRLRWGYAIDYYNRELYFEIEFQKYMQFKFFEQWKKLKKYANDQGIKIIGDVPIYVAMDSADTWASPELFALDEDNVPIAVAGCPPDGFAADGQLWGNPIYRWKFHKATGYNWWMTRLWFCFQLYDVTRIDHFRGFDEYYAIPYGDKTAANGDWRKGPGIDLFRCMKQQLGEHEIIAEDLGYVNDSVRDLVRDTGFPGMKVLEFAFDTRDTGDASDYLPHNYPVNAVVYTGTHDNETLAGWFASIPEEDRQHVRNYLCDHHTPDEEMHGPLVALVMRSVARLCIIPIQDYLGYDNSCRINKPSTLGCNWRWRISKEAFTDELQKQILSVTRRYGRLNRK